MDLLGLNASATRRARVGRAAVLAVLLLGACGPEKAIEASFAESFGPKISSDVTAPGEDLFSEGVTELMAEFARFLPDKTRVVSVDINGGAKEVVAGGGAEVSTRGGLITVLVQQLDNPTLVDEYLWSHQLGFRGPKGDEDLGTTPLETRTFSIDDVDWSSIGQMADRAVSEAAVPDAVATNLIVGKDFPATEGTLIVQVNVGGDRGSGSVRFTPAGELIEELG